MTPENARAPAAIETTARNDLREIFMLSPRGLGNGRPRYEGAPPGVNPSWTFSPHHREAAPPGAATVGGATARRSSTAARAQSAATAIATNSVPIQDGACRALRWA